MVEGKILGLGMGERRYVRDDSRDRKDKKRRSDW